MSRIGRSPVPIPKGVEVAVAKDGVQVKGPKGELGIPIRPGLAVAVADGVATVSREGKVERCHWGSLRAHLANAVTGVSAGFSYPLIIDGPGYRARVSGSKLHLRAGHSVEQELEIPSGVEVEITKQGVAVKGCDRQAVGALADRIIKVRPADPYKLRGIRRADIQVTKKKRRVVEAG